ncbi:MAG: peptidase inhibitor family I36 protein [Betaproteobacteria bacterium]
MPTVKRARILATASLLTIAVLGGGAGERDDGGQKRWGSEAMPRVGACFFEDSNFRGRYFCVDSNDDLGRLPRDMLDKISSLRVIGDVGVVVYRDEKFKGPFGRFLTDVRDLGKQGWNDRISSIRVTRTASAWDAGRLPAWGRESLPGEGACFYRDVDFKGDYFCMPRGASYALVPPEFNDQISSIRVIHAGGVLIFGDRDFDGRVARLTSDVADLRRGAWNDRISSIRVF